MTRRVLLPALIGLAALTLVACADEPDPPTPATTEQTVAESAAESAAADSQEFPDILEAKVGCPA